MDITKNGKISINMLRLITAVCLSLLVLCLFAMDEIRGVFAVGVLLYAGYGALSGYLFPKWKSIWRVAALFVGTWLATLVGFMAERGA